VDWTDEWVLHAELPALGVHREVVLNSDRPIL
jgi:hypothetical protein